MNKPKISCIYLDMDGVIADFEKRYIELFGIAPQEAEKSKKFDHYFEMFIANNGFADLPLMPGAIKGLEYLRKASVPTQMLTSSSDEKRFLLGIEYESLSLSSPSNSSSLSDIYALFFYLMMAATTQLNCLNHNRFHF